MAHIDSGGDPNSVKAGRELADISIPALVHHGLYLVIVCVIVWFAMMGLFKVVIGRLQDGDPQVSALARPAGEVPPGPRLLTNEPLNLQQFRIPETGGFDATSFEHAVRLWTLVLEISIARVAGW